MTFVSYAQNHEDVLLFRALGHVRNGVYVDVGASHPEEDSVTKAFYDRGWTGVNIEPSPQTFALLDRARIYDVNLNIAVSNVSEEVIFYDAPRSGLSTLVRSAGEMLEESGFKPDRIALKTERLDTILDRHGVRVIHFLKIDVEGAEGSVIKGAGLERHRPWIILVEATLPNSNTPNHFEWDHLICAANYHFVYFDGVNRYYVADEHPELDASFAVPVNVLDCYIRLSEHRLKRHARRLELDRELLDQKINTLSAAISSAQGAHANAIVMIEKMNGNLVPQLIHDRILAANQLVGPKVRSILIPGIRAAYRLISRFPRVFALLNRRLKRLPYVKMQLRKLFIDSEVSSNRFISPCQNDHQPELSQLVKRVRDARTQRRI
jgi:FkbM family methyltransferase